MTTNTRGPYAKTAAVQRRILDAARQAFAESGYRATTMKSVADLAGISHRGLVHHFATKEDLLTGVLAANDRRVAESFPTDTGLAALRSIVDLAGADRAEPSLIELYAILTAEAVAPDHPAHAYYRRRYETFRSYVTQQFETAIESRQLRPGAHAPTLAAQFTALLDGLETQWLYDRSTELVGLLHAFLDSCVCDD